MNIRRALSHPKIMKVLAYLPLGLLIALVTRLAYISIYKWGPAGQHDYPSYHLPFIVRTYNISTWDVWPNMLLLWEGWPPLGHLVQGAVILLTGKPAYANLVSTLAIVLFIGAVRYIRPTLDRVWLLLGFFALPMFMLNYPTGGLDVWFSLGTLVAFMALNALLLGDDRLRMHVVFTLAVAFVTYSKMNGWAVMLFFSGIYSLHMLRRIKTQTVAVLLAWLAIAVAVGGWPLRNWIIMGSPFWPIGIPGITLGGADPSKFVSPVVQPDLFREIPRLLRYVVSFFEINRLFTDEPVRWSYTMWAGGSHSAHQMMGGLNGALMVACVGYFILLLRRKAIPRVSLILLAGATLIAASLVQSHEMRYGLYIPLLLIYLCIEYGGNIYPKLFRAILLIGLVIICNDAIGMLKLKRSYPLHNVFPEIKTFWRENAGKAGTGELLCIPDTDTKWTLADPLGIYFTGPTLKEFHIRVCRPDCTLPWQACPFEW